jgi:hypothetical protein
MKLTVFTVDRETGYDNGHGKEQVLIEEGSHEAHFKEAIGSACMSVINRLRASGVDARQYDLNVRFE